MKIVRSASARLLPALVVSLMAASAFGCGDGRVQSDGSEPQTPAAQTRRPDVTVPSGTVLTVEMLQTVSSDTSQPGDVFQARVVEPVSVNQDVAIAAGSTVTGRIAQAVPSKKIGGQASLGLSFDSVRLRSGDEIPISASLFTAGKSQTKKDAATIGGSTAGGAVLGRVIGHNRGDKDTNGTVIGAVVGAAVGTSIAATNKNAPATIAEGTVLHIRLESPVTLIARN